MPRGGHWFSKKWISLEALSKNHGFSKHRWKEDFKKGKECIKEKLLTRNKIHISKYTTSNRSDSVVWICRAGGGGQNVHQSGCNSWYTSILWPVFS